MRITIHTAAPRMQIISRFIIYLYIYILRDEATGVSCAAAADLVSTVYPLRAENRPAGSGASDSHGEHQHRRNPFPSICVETSIKLPVGHFGKVKIIYRLKPVQPG